MNTRKLSGPRLQISELSLGCMSLPKEYDSSKEILDAAIEGGISLLDTADLYQKGWNEEMLGNALKGRRNQLVLASKVGNQLRPDGSGWDWNPKKKYILGAVEESLKRLQTDYIDLFQLHGGTIEDPWDETLEAFELLKTQGKIRAFGISSIRPNVIRKVLSASKPATIMMQYNPLDRRPEESAFPTIAESETKVLVRGSLAKGLLINKPEKDFLDFTASEVVEMRKEILNLGYRPEAFLIKFGLSQSVVASLVIGTSGVGQVEKMLKGYEESFAIPNEAIEEFKKKFRPNYYQQHR